MNKQALDILTAAMSGAHPRFAVVLEAERFVVWDKRQGHVIGRAGSASGAVSIIADAGP